MGTLASSASVAKHVPAADRTGVALCLSGGGFRAALFHLGSLRRLNETGVLAQITTITSVSGGSIANGLLAKMWPQFVFDPATGVITNFGLYEAALRAFCGKDLRTGPLLTERLDPRNWLHLLGDDHSATDFLAHHYEDGLVGDLKLGALPAVGAPQKPAFVFCASNMQTGVSFEMSGKHVGDYQIGHARLPEFKVADAIAASSAFPIAFPPLVLKFDPAVFVNGRLTGDRQRACARRIALTDGGVYDNMGLEPVWKSHQTVLVSDGGKPFGIDPDPGTIISSRLLRSNDLIGNQAAAVRKRWLIDALSRGVYTGSYWGIGTEIDDYPCFATAPPAQGYRGEVLDLLRAVRTDLNVFKPGLQAVLMNHAWALADAALRSFPGTLAPKLAGGVAPDAGLFANAPATAALS